jgi:hypothetical protein
MSPSRLNIEDEAQLTKENVDNYIRGQIEAWTEYDYKDYQLWECFVEDFEGWTSATFMIGDINERRHLRNHLSQRGVFVERKGKVPIAPALEKVLQEEEPHVWTDEEINKQMVTPPYKNTSTKAKKYTPSTRKRRLTAYLTREMLSYKGNARQRGRKEGEG